MISYQEGRHDSHEEQGQPVLDPPPPVGLGGVVSIGGVAPAAGPVLFAALAGHQLSGLNGVVLVVGGGGRTLLGSAAVPSLPLALSEIGKGVNSANFP